MNRFNFYQQMAQEHEQNARHLAEAGFHSSSQVAAEQAHEARVQAMQAHEQQAEG